MKIIYIRIYDDKLYVQINALAKRSKRSLNQTVELLLEKALSETTTV